MTAEKLAKRYAGKVVKCRITKSLPIASGQKEFDGRIIGWKRATGSEPEYVAVEVLPPGTTKFLVAHFKAGYTFTYDGRNSGNYAKKLLVEEIIIPTDGSLSRAIPAWPHTCPACSSPAQILFHMIDCSNEKCKHKFKTNSGVDLFIPKDMRPELKTPAPAVKKRDYADAQGFVLCRCGKRADRLMKGHNGTTLVYCATTKCALNPARVIKPQKGDRITMAGIIHEFDGNMTWVKK